MGLHDPPLEGDGFELPVPLRAPSVGWCVEQHRLVDGLRSREDPTRAGAPTLAAVEALRTSPFYSSQKAPGRPLALKSSRVRR